MANIKLKSDENFDAAILLVSNKMYNASIHCSYYSCFQLLKYTLKLCGINYDDQKNNYTSYCNNFHGEGKKLGSHDYLIQEFIKRSANKDMPSTISINRYISYLKALRNKADYNDEIVNDSDSIECSKQAKEARILIIKIYDL